MRRLVYLFELDSVRNQKMKLRLGKMLYLKRL